MGSSAKIRYRRLRRRRCFFRKLESTLQTSKRLQDVRGRTVGFVVYELLSPSYVNSSALSKLVLGAPDV